MELKPQGNDIAADAGQVRADGVQVEQDTSASGSSIFSPILNAGVGVTGPGDQVDFVERLVVVLANQAADLSALR